MRQKLLSAARAETPADSVPYAFEKRITALLQSQPAADSWALWARALWRAALPCVAVMLLIGAIAGLSSTTNGNGNQTASVEEFPQDFQQTMLAAVDQFEEVW
ncbi:MAG TPA: hypothetical protein PKA41_10090 [Verrucomicrobiota bacterium]|nr:hypothetical protein [Verrucomicrobiota bacterium]